MASSEPQTDSDSVGTSVLQKLRWARPSHLSQKRKIDSNVKLPQGNAGPVVVAGDLLTQSLSRQNRGPLSFPTKV